MITIDKVCDVNTLIVFLGWSLVVLGLASALFSSFLASEAQYRISAGRAQQDEVDQATMRQLSWEIRNRLVYDEDVIKRVPHAVKQPLTPTQVAEKRLQLNKLARKTLGYRALMFFMNCVKCQTSWSALLLLLIFAPAGTSVLTFVATVFAYSTASTFVYSYWRSLDAKLFAAKPEQTSCGCGKNKQ